VARDTETICFILQDAKKRWYLWEEWESELLRIPDVWTEGFESNEEIVIHFIVHILWIEEEAIPVYCDRDFD
jgi:hypothetical protein